MLTDLRSALVLQLQRNGVVDTKLTLSLRVREDAHLAGALQSQDMQKPIRAQHPSSLIYI